MNEWMLFIWAIGYMFFMGALLDRKMTKNMNLTNGDVLMMAILGVAIWPVFLGGAWSDSCGK